MLNSMKIHLNGCVTDIISFWRGITSWQCESKKEMAQMLVVTDQVKLSMYLGI